MIYIGYLAGALTTLSFMPQLLRIWRRKSAADISYAALLAFIVGIACWLWYGIAINAWPIIIANGVTLALNIGILGLKLLHHEGRS